MTDEVVQKIITYHEIFCNAGRENLLKDYPMMISPFEMLLIKKLNDSFMNVGFNAKSMIFHGVSLKVVE